MNKVNAREKIKIVQVCSSTSWGGMEMHVSVLAQNLKVRDFDVAVLCTPRSPLDDNLHKKGVRTLAFSPHGYIDLSAIIKTVRFFRSEKIDLIHSHYSKDLWVLAPTARLAGRIPIVFIKHIGTQKPKRDILHRWIYRQVCHTIAISRIIEKNIVDTHPIAGDRVSVIYHGLELDKFIGAARARDKIRKEFNIKPCQIVIGTIGRLQEGKGHLEFLDMARVIGQEFSDTCFMIVGEPTRGEEFRARTIHEKIASINLRDRIILTGYREDIPQVLSAMDIFAFPSRAEAFGLVLIEAMAAGKPVISTRSDGVLDIVEEDVNGLLFEPNNLQHFIECVRRLLEKTELRKKLGQAGFSTVSNKFNMSRMLDDIEKIYAKCLGNRTERL